MNTRSGEWPALWALCLGFFMIMVDGTIVAVANPVIMRELDADINSVVWVTSAYLLAYAVPLLVTGRLGDRFGPKRIYLAGLVLFTAASLWCGLSGTIAVLILARVFQGLGAALMSPQTMAIITRIFPPDRRGAAMGMWGAVAGVASLVGPLAGGGLVDGLGWEWIFFVNVPVGVLAFVMAVRLVPNLETHSHTFDLPGVALSGAGMFLLVFGIQEGNSYDWSAKVWGCIAAGVVLLVVFVLYQGRMRGEPLVPLELFRDRNFSLANIGIVAIGFTVTAMTLPLMFYAQAVRGLSPTGSALLMVPMAVFTGILAPFVGRLVDRVHPRYIAGTGFALLAISLVWLSAVMTPDSPTWSLLLPSALMGVAMTGIWSPLSATATNHLAPQQAGAGSGVYNTDRQIGAVLGSAAMGALMTSRLAAEGLGGGGSSEMNTGVMPEQLHEPFSTAMAQSMWLPAAVLLVGLVASLFFARPHTQVKQPVVPESDTVDATHS
ncbi:MULTISPECIES: MFS transporter [unclassified Rhodococcus (in: high G+C Gram-positive bacteria)]|uniref:MFS transporter n=1 Tax=unclassified Rhodococcus (in: high G+C Gram-positive bacteria) TaxID=192944 RepID=UPI0027DC24AE|nr:MULTISPECIES: MFS transporter [unclassified Rhodococcus (in: high G+C Gram-positive bacteria)]